MKEYSAYCKKGEIDKFLFFLLIILCVLFLVTLGTNEAFGQAHAKYIILMIADGWRANHIEATKKYCQSSGLCITPPYLTDPLWTKYWMSTFPYGGSYDPSQAWTNFNYVKQGTTDSAAAATAFYCGFKTQNDRINVTPDSTYRLSTIGEKAKLLSKAVGAVSTVPISHATPGVFVLITLLAIILMPLRMSVYLKTQIPRVILQLISNMVVVMGQQYRQ
ncbi:MAG: alkaline phosphatase [Nitrospirota bacterium]